MGKGQVRDRYWTGEGVGGRRRVRDREDMPKGLIRELNGLLKSFLVVGTCGDMVAHVEIWWLKSNIVSVPL